MEGSLKSIGQRIKVFTREDELALHIAAYRPPGYPLTLVFLSFWLAAWTMSGLAVLVATLLGRAEETPLSVQVLSLAIWLVGGVNVLYQVLWLAFGKEVITLQSGRVTIKRDILGRGWTTTMPTNEVTNVRTLRNLYGRWLTNVGLVRAGLAGGRIALDWRGKVYRFGIQLTIAEAEIAACILKERLLHGR